MSTIEEADSDSGVFVEHEDIGTTKSDENNVNDIVNTDVKVDKLQINNSDDIASNEEIKDDHVNVDVKVDTLSKNANDGIASDEKDGVDAAPIDLSPGAIQIVSIGTEADDFSFTYHSDKMNLILDRCPDDHKVCVVSVVGAFRTGKSFLLTWFLRYLHHHYPSEDTKTDSDPNPELVDEDDSTKEKEGNKEWYESFANLGNDGFSWKAGSDRNTTGIWMWSHPFIVKEQKRCILLVDTQGMFDHETSMALTSSIFGLSTLLSSYQIYNVDKRIQEDNLQQLALFSEYARMAVTSNSQTNDQIDDQNKEEEEEVEVIKRGKPFQLVEFLVRDWQHFDDFEEDQDYDAMEKSMKDYLEKLIADRDAEDLQETREQITSCFQKVSCYGLSHPGFPVTKKKYAGQVDQLETEFLNLLCRYCKRVFDQAQPKVINGVELLPKELGAYIKSYASLFATGASFPEASTMLEATAAANNTTAISRAVMTYKENMDHVAGARCSDYLAHDELQEQHRQVKLKTLAQFSKMANFGSERKISESKRSLLFQIEKDYELYEQLNQSRNPLFGFETYFVPMGIAFAAYFLRVVADWTCAPWSHICKRSSIILSEVYAVVFCFMAIIAFTKAKQISEVMKKVKKTFEVVVGDVQTISATNSTKTKVE